MENNKASITLDLYKGDELVRRLDIACPENLKAAFKMYEMFENVYQSVIEELQQKFDL